ncbi:ATP-dependent DNA helicase RecG [Commensalibacter papalotli (ex Botero et al. 2024)]|uniref:Probable DNA 3'-5' helicase RecG n=1 Tax=Commensalibacter papalotli (ex Botero et al. 2024) TaxID=2972766 RepID=A0ABM9HNT8_9PROT|nr:ATP-dependent DNA helicase RecG [Commensalibacter papalotli (ex Botero et al. 2024)]CAI3934666.1 RecG-like helicase (RecG) (PDB:1GM5) [Commensalibacter papalotli (ex Botero et al. 2024)]CAI3941057.1 RecG-like helicase (RecG) (PDB:1GM5) [Commensalibacter papalotli (ex Botero et al. 2024)]
MDETSISSTTQLALVPLLAPLSNLEGVGPKTSQLIAKAAGGHRVIDLLLHLPESIIDRRYRPTLQNAIPGRIATLKVQVIHIEKPLRSKQPWRVHVTDGTKNAELSFFSQWQAKKVKPNTQIIVSGTLETYGNRLQITNPHYLEPLQNEYMIPLIEPIWPLTAGLFPKNLYKVLRSALAKCPTLPEWIDPLIIQKNQWPSFKEALHLLHFPGDFPELFDKQSYEAAESRARSRLAFDELFAEQLAIGQAKRATQKNPGRALIGNQTLCNQALQKFGYPLTQSQEKTLKEIKKDLKRPFRMLRLLQGDVGSGKTIVALLTALHAVEAGFQAVIMAPTEILARQHFEFFSQLCSAETIFLSGSVKGNARKEVLEKLHNGTAKIAIGTHALFQEGVEFHNLALVIIDEQHRFGVEQRIKLGDKGENTDILVMTATPIPRTLLLTRWGELQVSRLTEKPAGRKPIHTTLHNLSTMGQIMQGVERMISQGCQIFWVCPLVEESEVMDLAAAKDRFIDLKHHFGENKVGLAHGQQDSQERQDALDAFANNQTKILVATTVIEVGVNIPNANIMVIEHAERFGLAQLHQLRGRVGRGEKQSYCLLLHDDKINFTAKKRLALLRDTEDGFLIADEDFKIRGGGEVTGRRQSGLPDFKVVDEIRLEQWIDRAWQSAEQWFQYEPKAPIQQKEAIESLLLLFAKNNAGRLLRSG